MTRQPTHFTGPLSGVSIDEYMDIVDCANNETLTWKQLHKYLDKKPSDLQVLFGFDIMMGSVSSKVLRTFRSDIEEHYPAIASAIREEDEYEAFEAKHAAETEALANNEVTPHTVRCATRDELVDITRTGWMEGEADFEITFNQEVLFGLHTPVVRPSLEEMNEELIRDPLTIGQIINLLYNHMEGEHRVITMEGADFLVSHMDPVGIISVKEIKKLLKILLAERYSVKTMTMLVRTALGFASFHHAFVSEVLKYRRKSPFGESHTIIVGNYYNVGAWVILDGIERQVDPNIISSLKKKHRVLAKALFPSFYKENPGMEALLYVKRNAFIASKRDTVRSAKDRAIIQSANNGDLRPLIDYMIRSSVTKEDMLDRFPLEEFDKNIRPQLLGELSVVYMK